MPSQNMILRPSLYFWRKRKIQRPYNLLLRRSMLMRDDVNGGRGYFSGKETGIVTVGGIPASRHVLCMRRDNLKIVRDTWSNEDGTYLIKHLNPDHHYIIMALDNPDGRYDPIAYDMLKPHVDTA